MPAADRDIRSQHRRYSVVTAIGELTLESRVRKAAAHIKAGRSSNFEEGHSVDHEVKSVPFPFHRIGTADSMKSRKFEVVCHFCRAALLITLPLQLLLLVTRFQRRIAGFAEHYVPFIVSIEAVYFQLYGTPTDYLKNWGQSGISLNEELNEELGSEWNFAPDFGPAGSNLKFHSD